MKIKDYTDAYLKERWAVILRRIARGADVDAQDEIEVRNEMLRRGFDVK